MSNPARAVDHLEVSITLNSQRQLQILLFVQEDRVLGARWGFERVAADPGVMPI